MGISEESARDDVVRSLVEVRDSARQRVSDIRNNLTLYSSSERERVIGQYTEKLAELDTLIERIGAGKGDKQ